MVKDQVRKKMMLIGLSKRGCDTSFDYYGCGLTYKRKLSLTLIVIERLY